MGHHHGHHHHDHTHGANKKTLTIAFFIIAAYMVVELIGGLLTNSLALLSDAGHMLSDAISLGVAVLAFQLGERAANYEKTFGYKRFEILAAAFNGITLLIIAIFIIIEAVKRFAAPPEIATTGMLTISTIGLLVNILVAWIMFRGGDTEENLNMRGAFLHVIGDMLGSVGAIIAALLIMFFGWSWADPVASIIVALIIMRSGFYVTKDSIQVLMEGTPKNIKVEDIIKTIENVPGIKSIHDLHVWSITSGHNALSCHAVVDTHITIEEGQRILDEVEHQLIHKGINHITIQMESENHDHHGSVLCNHQGLSKKS
ncbi:cation diffusion facilitator family transporter [Pallidibacillus pasinlerensis]|uniref:Cation transporter n=1 Tax=Pallidibacillus pasinlerensis TaxID=2703818 RepID=A0ABX0A4N9_9BACI|nr:cation diffusion facilitator family transporter [Pallidibacillus pasinlerensis]NCU18406.1 cation transporter [Pallidibacillus pasinlerensis]